MSESNLNPTPQVPENASQPLTPPTPPTQPDAQIPAPNPVEQAPASVPPQAASQTPVVAPTTPETPAESPEPVRQTFQFQQPTPAQAGNVPQQAPTPQPSPAQPPVPPQGQPVPQQGQPQNPAQKKPLSSLAVAGLVLAIIAIVLSWVPLINNLAFIIGIIGAVIAAFALHATGKKGKKRGHGMAISALIVSLLSLVLVVGTQNVYSSAIDKAVSDTSASSSSSSKKSSENAKKTPKKAENTVQDMEGDIDGSDYHIKLDSLVKSGNDYEGKPTVMLTYELTNNKDENSNFMDTNVVAFQNGHQLQTATYLDNPEGYDPMSTSRELQPGATGTATEGFVLEDEVNPVTVEATGTVDFSHQKVSHEFAIQ